MSICNYNYSPQLVNSLANIVVNDIYENPANEQLKVQSVLVNNTNPNYYDVEIGSTLSNVSLVLQNINNDYQADIYGFFNNSDADAVPSCFTLENKTTNKYCLTFLNSNNFCGINNTNPKSQLSVKGLQEYANNATAIDNGLGVGDFYYTIVGGDAFLKVVI